MSAIRRLSFCAGTLAAALIGLKFTQPGSMLDLPLELPRLPESRAGACAEDPCPEELKLRSQMVVARISLKRMIVEDLCVGRLTLLEAAARFRTLDRILPSGYAGDFRRFYGGRSDEECYCLQVIYATEIHLKSLGRPLAPMLPRLNAELQEMLAYGNLRLP